MRESVEMDCSQRLPIAFQKFNEATLFFDPVKTKAFERKFQAINNAFKKTPPIVPMYSIMTTNDELRACLEKYTGTEEYSKDLKLVLKSCEDALNSYIQET